MLTTLMRIQLKAIGYPLSNIVYTRSFSARNITLIGEFCPKLSQIRDDNYKKYINLNKNKSTMHFNYDQLDDVNLKILDILSRDSSTPFVEIAKQIGISDATVHIRVRRLTAAGIISKFTISVNNNLLGYDHLAFMGINVEPGSAEEVTVNLTNIDEVLEIHEMHGRFDLLLKIRAKDLNQMREIVVNKIRKLPSIIETELMTVLKSRKEEQIVSLRNDIADPMESTMI
jgi:Lrp/AsnC family transcriptional regulator for asnA, asnC and gidA